MRREGGGANIAYVGDIYEQLLPGGTVTKYYYADGRRIAVRAGGALKYIIQDHQGSTVATTNGTVRESLVRYYPFGHLFSEWGTILTDKRYTGQQREYEAGANAIYDYGARMYDAKIGRFLQPDPVMDPYDPQSLNRYSYVRNNPTSYTDPTGMIPMSDGTHSGPVWLYEPAGAPDWLGPIDLLDPPQSSGLDSLLDVAEFVPFYNIGDAVSALRLAQSCLEGSCDAWRAVGIAPIVPGKAGPFLKNFLKASDKASDAARIAHALQSGILSYRDAAKLTRGLGGQIEAHHILEQRHMKAWEYSLIDIAEAPAIVVTKEEHHRLTTQLRTKLP